MITFQPFQSLYQHLRRTDTNLANALDKISLYLMQLVNSINNVASAPSTLPAIGTPGTYEKVTTDAEGRVIAGTTLSIGDIPVWPSTISSPANTTNTVFTNSGLTPRIVTVSLIGYTGLITFDCDNGAGTTVVQSQVSLGNTEGHSISFTVPVGYKYQVAATGATVLHWTEQN